MTIARICTTKKGGEIESSKDFEASKDIGGVTFGINFGLCSAKVSSFNIPITRGLGASDFRINFSKPKGKIVPILFACLGKLPELTLKIVIVRKVVVTKVCEIWGVDLRAFEETKIGGEKIRKEATTVFTNPSH